MNKRYALLRGIKARLTIRGCLPDFRQMARPVARFLAVFVILAVAVAIGGSVLTLSRTPPAPPLPNPNGYDDLLKAAGMITDDFSDSDKIGEQKLRTLMTNNSVALQLARVGLTRQCRPPMDYSPTNNALLTGLSGMKRLALALAAEGSLAELENRRGDAAESYLTIIRLGTEVGRGGPMINSLVGIAIETIGAAKMEKLMPALDAERCQEVASALEAAEARQESAAAVLEQEREWVRRVYGFKGVVTRLILFKSIRKAEQGWTARLAAREIRERRLIIDLAARAYEAEKGQRPGSVGDLVPGYLKSIPQDPLTGTNMNYRL
jgi:hypothetical protein